MKIEYKSSLPIENGLLEPIALHYYVETHDAVEVEILDTATFPHSIYRRPSFFARKPSADERRAIDTLLNYFVEQIKEDCKDAKTDDVFGKTLRYGNCSVDSGRFYWIRAFPLKELSETTGLGPSDLANVFNKWLMGWNTAEITVSWYDNETLPDEVRRVLREHTEHWKVNPKDDDIIHSMPAPPKRMGPMNTGRYLLGATIWEAPSALELLEYRDKQQRRKEYLASKFAGKREASVRRPMPEGVRMFVWNRDGGRCTRCGSRQNLEYDHIIPVSKGGSNTARNIELLCEKCNRGKRDAIGN